MCNTDYHENQLENIMEKLIRDSNFKSIDDLDKDMLDNNGFYCIRMKRDSKLPDKYQNHLNQRLYKYIYIGKAEKTLKKRLEQELKNKGTGTFFRSIGCVLGKEPIEGHLKGRSNQYNFKFSSEVKNKIIEWIRLNIEVSIVAYNGDFNIEKDIIKEYSPLLNIDHNLIALEELKEDRKRCRSIALGL